MAHRTFVDSDGATWEVWDVVPGRLTLSARDHRAGADRRAPQSDTPQPAEERRTGLDRRASLAPHLRHGWLAFRTADERRRLAPIPHEWARATDEELARYCRAAKPVTPPRE